MRRGRAAAPIASSPRSHRAWKSIQLAIGPEFRTIAIDPLGFGHGTSPAGFTVHDHALSVAALIDELALDRAHFLGLHTGNKIGACLAAQNPERVDRFVFMGQTHSMVVDREARNKAVRAYEYRHSPRYPRAPDGSHLVREWTAAMAVAMEYALPPAMRVEPVVSARDIANAEARVLDHLMGRRGIFAMYGDIYTMDLTELIQRVQAPTLILELLTEVEAHFGLQGPLWVKAMRDARTATLNNADGVVIEYRPQEVIDAIVPFLLGR